jgi:hypothetical protein
MRSGPHGVVLVTNGRCASESPSNIDDRQLGAGFFELAESAERTASGVPPALRESAKIGLLWRVVRMSEMPCRPTSGLAD